MKRIIHIYTEHKNGIVHYLRRVVSEFDLLSNAQNDLKQIFEHEPSAQVIYTVSKAFRQSTPSYGRSYTDEKRMGTDKSFYFKWVSFENEPIHISNPYLHHISGNPTLTAVREGPDFYLVIDFDMPKLLAELRLIDHNSGFEKVNTAVMGTGAALLGLVAFFFDFVRRIRLCSAVMVRRIRIGSDARCFHLHHLDYDRAGDLRSGQNPD